MTFTVQARAQAGMARAGELTTSRNTVHTPCFMPVGTHAAVTGMTPAALLEHDAEILVCNAYRLFEQPSAAVLRGYASVHEFMAWPGTILTDSGGFQIYKLENRTIREEGVEFYTDTRERVQWTPEKAIEFQALLGSDLVMPLDVCVSLPTSHANARQAMERTVRWAERSQRAGLLRPEQTLFGIVQGAVFEDLRKQCIERLGKLGFRAYAIGGLNVGENADDFRRALLYTSRELPADSPRYLMGVGRPEAMLDAVSAGVDMMDSIIPTKYAREGKLITYRGVITITRPRYARDRFPIDPNCACYTCRHVTRGYMHHLYETTRTTAHMFAAMHNVAFCIRIMQEARAAIQDGRFAAFHERFLEEYQRGK